MERPLPRDRGLEIRMAIVLLLLLGFYGGIGVALWLPAVYDHHGSPVGYAVGVAILVWTLLWMQFSFADSRVLVASNASWIAAESEPQLAAAVARLAGLADVRPPRVALSRLSAPNALATGLRRRRRTIVVTESLPDLLTAEELEAVLAHEMSHFLNRDAMLMTAATSFETIGEFLGGRSRWDISRRFSARSLADVPSLVIVVVWVTALTPLRWALAAIGVPLTRTLSRYREYAADRGSALLTGRPEALMSALTKLAGAAPPTNDLRSASVSALWIVPVGPRRPFSWLSDHPPLESRLRRLEILAREMGHARPPHPRRPVP